MNTQPPHVPTLCWAVGLFALIFIVYHFGHRHA